MKLERLRTILVTLCLSCLAMSALNFTLFAVLGNGLNMFAGIISAGAFLFSGATWIITRD